MSWILFLAYSRSFHVLFREREQFMAQGPALTVALPGPPEPPVLRGGAQDGAAALVRSTGAGPYILYIECQTHLHTPYSVPIIEITDFRFFRKIEEKQMCSGP